MRPEILGKLSDRHQNIKRWYSESGLVPLSTPKHWRQNRRIVKVENRKFHITRPADCSTNDTDLKIAVALTTVKEKLDTIVALDMVNPLLPITSRNPLHGNLLQRASKLLYF